MDRRLINTLLFFAIWAFIAMFAIVIVMYFIMTPIHDKQIKLQEDMRKNDALLEKLRNG